MWRELRNVLERAAIVAGEGLIRRADLSSAALGVSPGPYARQRRTMRTLYCFGPASPS